MFYFNFDRLKAKLALHIQFREVFEIGFISGFFQVAEIPTFPTKLV